MPGLNDLPAAPTAAPCRSILVALAALGFLLAAATGCTRDPKPGLAIINGAEPESLDPALITAQPDTRLVLALFAGLTRNDPKTGAATPDLAASWEISPDGKTYLFHLRPNLRWSTGEPLTAGDVVYSWRRVLDPATAATYAGQLFFLRGAEDFNAGKSHDPASVGVSAPNPLTLRVELANPTPFFLDLCASQIYSVVPARAIGKYGDRWIKRQPVPVSGAYQLDFWRINDKIRFRRNPNYWDAANTRTELVDVYPIGSDKAALNLYQAGQVDIVWDKELVPSELVDLLLQRPDFHRFDYLGTYFIRFNVTRKPFDDPRVRRALALAIDKRRLVGRITRGGERPAGNMTPPGIPNYSPPDGLGYDPALARRLLAQAGYPDGRGFPVFHYLYNAAAGGGAKTHEKIGVELKEMWRKELGLTVELQSMESKIYWATMDALDYETCRSSWVGDYDDPNTFLDLFMSANGNNRTGWKNARYDGLLARANSERNVPARMALLRQAETLLTAEELPVIPLFFYAGINYFDGRKITGVYNNVLDVHPLNAIAKLSPAAPGGLP
jgi:oligopeptide transport system substrate-binding protein